MNRDLKKTQEGNTLLTRRQLLKAGVAGLGTAAVSQLAGCQTQTGGKIERAKAEPYMPSPNKPQYVFRSGITELNPDGAKIVPGVTLNGQFPGPEIRVKEGDMLRIWLENKLPEQATSVHWHGLLLPATMDGVPNVSHVPIQPNEIFVYEFPILQHGTYWYHSHFGFQEQIGLAGPFIIEAADEKLVYDHDYVIFLGDWLHMSPYKAYDELKKGTMKPADKSKGPDLSDVRYNAFLMNGKANNDPWTCTAKPGERIRFRIINAGTSTFFRFMVDEHPLTITHADGLAVQPVEVDNFLFGMGECYDALVTVDKSGSFTLRAEAQDGSGQAIGVLHTPDVKPKANLSRPNWGARALSYSQLLSVEPTTLQEGPARKFSINLTGDMKQYVWSMNDQVYPKSDPILFNYGDRVQIDMPNKTMMWHPMHLHGHFFRLLMPGVDPRFAPLKHTVSVPPKETIRFEFLADNPGKWFFHCHNLYHLEAGMAKECIYQAMDPEQSQTS